jgi:quercetin dioxygenase-like cupin family protein
VTRWQDIFLDDESMWPTEHRVTLPSPHADARGAIQPLVDLPIRNVSLITSQKGSVRSNHYHLTDWHFIFVLAGSFDYYFRPAGDTDAPQRLRIETGEMLFTPPMEEHATVFLEDSRLLVISRNVRDQDVYEADVRRVALIDPDRGG